MIGQVVWLRHGVTAKTLASTTSHMLLDMLLSVTPF